MGRVITGVIIGVDNAPGGRVVPPGEGGLGHLDQGLVLDIRLVVDEAVNLIQQGHAGSLQLGPCFWTIRIRAGTNERMICSRKSGRRENILAINSFELVSQPQ